MQVLLVRAGALGDLLLLRRAIAALRASGHGVSLLAPAAGSVLVGPAPGVERLLRWDGPETARLLAGEKATGPVADSLRASDVVIAYTRNSDVVSALSASTRRLLVHDPAPPPGWGASHWLAEPLSALGVGARAEPPALRFSADEIAAADAFLEALPFPFLAVHPGSGSPAKNWPAGHFLDLARRLADGRRCLLVLGPAEDGAPWFEPPGVLVARELPLRVLGAVLARAGLYVGNDSGISHLAAAAGAPTLTLFGPTDPGAWAPAGRRTGVLRHQPLSELDVATVEAAARALLAAPAPR